MKSGLLWFVCACGVTGMADAVAQCYDNVHVAYAQLIKQEKQQKNSVIDINTATAAELIGLVGVGHNSAQAIIEYRTRHGRFGSVDELRLVRGIGQATIEKNRHRLTVLKSTK